LLSRVAAPFQRQVVGFAQVALQVHDAGENAGLVEHGPVDGDGSDVAVDLEHGIVAKQLHPAVDDDLAAILADMAQLAGPITVFPQQRAKLGELDRPSCLQQRVAAAADRFAGRESVEPFGARVPELDRSVEPPHKHRLVRQRQKSRQTLRTFGICANSGRLVFGR